MVSVYRSKPAVRAGRFLVIGGQGKIRTSFGVVPSIIAREDVERPGTFFPGWMMGVVRFEAGEPVGESFKLSDLQDLESTGQAFTFEAFPFVPHAKLCVIGALVRPFWQQFAEVTPIESPRTPASPTTMIVYVDDEALAPARKRVGDALFRTAVLLDREHRYDSYDTVKTLKPSATSLSFAEAAYAVCHQPKMLGLLVFLLRLADREAGATGRLVSAKQSFGDSFAEEASGWADGKRLLEAV